MSDIETLRLVRDEMTEALSSGALFNPEMFGSMLKGSDNPILRWRDSLDAILAHLQPSPDLRGLVEQWRQKATKVELETAIALRQCANDLEIARDKMARLCDTDGTVAESSHTSHSCQAADPNQANVGAAVR